MRYTGPKNRIARREAMDLGLKTAGSKSQATLLRRLNVFPGQHTVKGRRKLSEHALQLREKQKLRYLFGVTERQAKGYFKSAAQRKGNTTMYLSVSFEKRLDNIVYRLGFAPTRSASRQLVSHGHIKVNDGIVTIPSLQVRIGDIITFSNEKSAKIPYVEKALLNKDVILPKWLERKGTAGKMVSEPTSELIENQINLRLVIEFYSR